MNQNSWDFPWNMRAVDELTTFSCLKYFKTQIHSTQRIHQSFHIKKKTTTWDTQKIQIPHIKEITVILLYSSRLTKVSVISAHHTCDTVHVYSTRFKVTKKKPFNHLSIELIPSLPVLNIWGGKKRKKKKKEE